MRQYTKKRAAQNRAAKKWRDDLCAEVGRCEHCLKPKAPEYLDVDEIACGTGHRLKALNAAFAVLVVCRSCHRIIQPWTRAKRLALLYLARTSSYDLPAFWALINRRFPSQAEVDAEVSQLLALRPSTTTYVREFP